MKRIINSHEPEFSLAAARWLKAAILVLALTLPVSAHASMFEGETLDAVANVMAWVVLFVAPIVGIAVFLLIHILPEKIAERKQHPQVKAIQCLCLLSLAFGGMLWPIAWLWAYTKPVLHQLAYGTDRVAHGEEQHAQPSPDNGDAEELKQLRQRIAELETKLAGRSAAEGGRV
jgi:CBS domain containing-hemolysin-like protein